MPQIKGEQQAAGGANLGGIGLKLNFQNSLRIP